MRRRRKLKTSLLFTTLVAACNGRVVVGTDLGGFGGVPGDEGGEAGASMTGGAGALGGSSGFAGADEGVAGERDGYGGDSSGGDAPGPGGNAGAGGDGAAPGRPHWVVMTTTISSESSLLSFLNLADPSSEPIRFEEGPWYGIHFSPDGHFACIKKRDDSGDQLFLVDTRGSALGEPRLLGRLGDGACSWSPDSEKLSCLANTPSGLTLEVALIDPASGALRKQVSLGPADSSPKWLGDDVLFFTNAERELVRAEFSPDGDVDAVRTGVAGNLLQVSSNRDIAVLSPTEWPATRRELMDLRTLEHAPPVWSDFAHVSPSFRSLVLSEYGPMPDERVLSYYWLDGIRAQLVGMSRFMIWQEEIRLLEFAGERFVELHDRQLILTTITPEGLKPEPVGDHRDIVSLDASVDGRWITFSKREEAVGTGRPTSRWLIHFDDDGIRSVNEIGPFTTPTEAAFSPDSSKLIVFPFDPYRDVPSAEPPVLLELGDSGKVTQRSFDLLYWTSGAWSDDSSFFVFEGGNADPASRSLYAVDVLDPAQPPRRLASCDEGSSTDPRCPGFALQP